MKRSIVFSLLAVLFIISSCNTEKRQLRKAQSFFLSHPNDAALFCATQYPVQNTRYVKGDSTVTHDTVLVQGDSIQCPPIKDGKVVFVKCPPQKFIYKTTVRRDTVFKKDSALVSVYINKYSTIRDTLTKTKTILEESQKANSRKSKVIWMLGIALVAVVGLSVLHFLKKF